MTLGAYLEEWLAEMRPTLSPSGWTNYRTLLRRYVIPRIGRVRLVDLKPATLSRLYGDLLESGGTCYVKNEKGRRVKDAGGAWVTKPRPLSPTTVRLVHRVVFHALSDAVQSGVLPVNPAIRARQPKARRAEVSVWQPADARRFLAAARGDRLYAMYLLALTAGLRRGELAGLRWSDVDLDREAIAIRVQRTTDADSKVVEKEPKGTSRRVVQVGPDVVAALRSHRTAQLAERLAAGPAWTDSGRVFVDEAGKPYHPGRLVRLFRRLCEQVGAPPIRLHDLRHTCATVLLVGGTHPKVVQERLGHASITITMDTYSHVVDGLQREAASVIESLLLHAGSSQ
jgi:integrase